MVDWLVSTSGVLFHRPRIALVRYGAGGVTQIQLEYIGEQHVLEIRERLRHHISEMFQMGNGVWLVQVTDPVVIAEIIEYIEHHYPISS